jgi:poly(A) polymerase Pap1
LAKVCQLFPNLKPNKLIEKFFVIYSEWNWEEVPVIIEEIKTYDNLERFNEMQWYDPKSDMGMEKINQKKKDAFSSNMMVSTPAFPCMNSTKKVTRTNLNIIKDQIIRGREFVLNKPVQWAKLFEKITFFNDYYNFIELSVIGNDEAEFNKWKGLVESQIIVLTNLLEAAIEATPENMRKLFLHPYPVGYETFDPLFKFCQRYYFGLKYKATATARDQNFCDLSHAVLEFVRKIELKREGQYKAVNLRINHLIREELPDLDQPVSKAATHKEKPKRPFEYSHDTESEPTVGKKVHGKEEVESKSTNFATSNSASPGDLYPSSYGTGNQKTNGVTTTAHKEAEENKAPYIPQERPAEKAVIEKPQPKPIPGPNTFPAVGKTDFNFIDSRSLLNQRDDLDELW